MQKELFQTKAHKLLESFEDLLKRIPQKGNTSDTCQKATIQTALNNLVHAVNGLTDEDFDNQVDMNTVTNEYLDRLSIEELEKLLKEVEFRIKYPWRIGLRTAGIEYATLSVRTISYLKRAGIRTIGELHKMPSSEVIKIKNIGKKTVADIAEYFEYLGMDWDWKYEPKK